jgi:8-hydroxy-5-deazaflavin:NADPH oxidoreductase
VALDSTGELNRIAILGGTGKEGKGLAFRWVKAGKEIIIGSRTPEKAQVAAADILALSGGEGALRGCSNEEAAHAADIVVLTVPYAVHREMLETFKPWVQDKIFIDVTVPLVPPRVTRVQMPAAGSAGQEAQAILGEKVRVVTAFQNISYENLIKGVRPTCDVLVCGNDKAARGVVLGLVRLAGLVGWDAGPIENSVGVEGLTSILIGINKQFGVQASGIQITGTPRPQEVE